MTTKILVVGGGPAGSTAATLLARQGHAVTLLERSHFPRYHIGESLLPTVLQVLDLLGAREKMEALGFQRKRGAHLEWGDETWGLDFGELGENCTYAFQVERADFDDMLLKHAASQGVRVLEGTEVERLTFEGDRPVQATWRTTSPEGETSTGEIGFDYLIDASGRRGLMATRYLKNRRYHRLFQNVALWGYWEGADRLATGREGDIAVASIPDGWLWAIPLRGDVTSVGAVVPKAWMTSKRGESVEGLLMDCIKRAPLIERIIAKGRATSSVSVEQDYSYASSRFCGPGYIMIGDAACFLDPLLSSGVHLATYGGLLAAASLSSVLSGEVTEAQATAFFEGCYRQAYLRFMVFLSAFYDVGRKKESYFQEAQQLTEHDVSAVDLKRAFLNLVTGIKDLDDAKSDAHRVVLETMTERVNENLGLRKDKRALAEMEGAQRVDANANARFFTSVEGLFALNETHAVEGLFVSTEPYPHLERASRGSR